MAQDAAVAAPTSGISVLPAGPGTWPEVEHALSGGGDGPACWCQWPLLTGREFESASRGELRDRLRVEVEDGDGGASGLPPGLIARVDGEAAGWCRIGPRNAQPRLGRSRVVRAAGASPLDDPGVWALSCFVVRREFRRRGVARELARSAVDFARDHGARIVEAYPVDAQTRPGARANDLFVGTASMLASVGFREAGRPTASRVVMTVSLGE
ncbi:MAG: N-acetyltransferase [Actinomyces sp.]|jgi:GNAT superfamily N-acetyltransferase|nr:GNAT family N-acetyltransferase [Actinomyces sp.]MCI1662640.1 N-acetyltransferase [Actinomyces sp.]MCI1787426.1 N-acetyltransferase [Actinomyces sp.]MCI1830756.1 N-acetyltransferase [Actinomyces sp.]